MNSGLLIVQRFFKSSSVTSLRNAASNLAVPRAVGARVVEFHGWHCSGTEVALKNSRPSQARVVEFWIRGLVLVLVDVTVASFRNGICGGVAAWCGCLSSLLEGRPI